MIQEIWDAGQSKFRLKTEGLERIRYRPYGFAERQILADINGDGSVNLDDLNFVMTNFGAAIGSSGYAAQVDTDSSGSINLDDHNAVLMAFGTSVPTDGSLWLNAPGMVGYGGGLYDEIAGLYLFRNRYYDPTEGRWITRDPAGYVDGLNLYQYVQGNPLMYFDPFGLSGNPIWEKIRPLRPGDDGYIDYRRGARQTRLVQIAEQKRNYISPDGKFNDFVNVDSKGRYRNTVRKIYRQDGKGGCEVIAEITYDANDLSQVMAAGKYVMSENLADFSGDLAATLETGIRLALPAGDTADAVAEFLGDPSLRNGVIATVSVAGVPLARTSRRGPDAQKLTPAGKKRLAKEQGEIPRSAQPIAQGRYGEGTKWWEYKDANGNRKIVVEHPDGSVHMGRPKPQSSHLDGSGPPKYYPVPGTGHVGD